MKYRIVVTNKGPGPAPATVTDKLPAAMHFLSVTKPCKQKAGIVTCKLGTLAVGKKSKPIVVAAQAVGVGHRRQRGDGDRRPRTRCTTNDIARAAS